MQLSNLVDALNELLKGVTVQQLADNLSLRGGIPAEQLPTAFD